MTDLGDSLPVEVRYDVDHVEILSKSVERIHQRAMEADTP